MIRFALLLAAATLAGLAAPVQAQDGPQEEVPALPPLADAPRVVARTRLAYSAEQRDAWLGQCQAVYRQAGTCEAYLARYEQAATDPLAYYGGQVTRVRSRREADDDCPDDGDARMASDAIAPADHAEP